MWETLWRLIDGHNGIAIVFFGIGYSAGAVLTIVLARPRYCARCGQYMRWIDLQLTEHRNRKAVKGRPDEPGEKGDPARRAADGPGEKKLPRRKTNVT